MKSFRRADRFTDWWHAVLMIILASGCSEPRPVSHATPEDTKTEYPKSAPFADSVVFSSKQIPSLREYFNPTWDPPKEAVAKALEQLPEFLNHAGAETFPSIWSVKAYVNELPGLAERMPTTVCQIVGVTFEGRKGILLNCLPVNGSLVAGWREHFVKVYDGGPRYWSVVYLPDEQKFTRLYIDQGF